MRRRRRRGGGDTAEKGELGIDQSKESVFGSNCGSNYPVPECN